MKPAATSATLFLPANYCYLIIVHRDDILAFFTGNLSGENGDNNSRKKIIRQWIASIMGLILSITGGLTV